MKGFLFILGFLFTSQICNSQVLVKENKLWSNLEYGSEQPENQFYHSYYIKFEGDTSIENVSYKKVLRADDSQHLNWWSYGFTREDSTGKVFAFQVPGTSSDFGENLIYDFGLNKGDSIADQRGGQIYVDSVININLANNYHKAIFLSSGDVWITGVGSTKGIFQGFNNTYLCCIYRFLICNSDHDTLIYQNTDFSTCYIYHYPAGMTHILKIGEVFDFEIGDEFHYKTTFNNNQALPNADRVKVIDKSISQDSITYTFHHDRYNSSISNQVLVHYFDQYNERVSYGSLDSNILSLASIDSLTFGLYIHGETYCNLMTNTLFVRDPYWIGEASYKVYTYGKGLGQTMFNDEAPEGSWELTMFYYNKQGISCGTPDLTTSVDNVKNQKFLKIYPNPVSEFLTIEGELTSVLEVNIYNLTGKIVFSQSCSESRLIVDLSGIQKGIYLIRIKSGNQVVHQKILKL